MYCHFTKLPSSIHQVKNLSIPDLMLIYVTRTQPKHTDLKSFGYEFNKFGYGMITMDHRLAAIN